MKEPIAVNEYYEIYIDRDKNRAYMVFRGFWKNLEMMPDIEKDLTAYPKILKPQFTTLLDLREFKTPGPDVMEKFIKIQQENAKYEYYKAARIVTQPLEKLAADRVGKEADMKEKTAFFNSLEEAEAWLDE